MCVQLGKCYVDEISGFTGIAISKHEYLNGCSRFTLQPKIDKDGKLPECQTFDEPTLCIVPATESYAIGDRKVGGPEKYSDTNRYSGE